MNPKTARYTAIYIRRMIRSKQPRDLTPPPSSKVPEFIEDKNDNDDSSQRTLVPMDY